MTDEQFQRLLDKLDQIGRANGESAERSPAEDPESVAEFQSRILESLDRVLQAIEVMSAVLEGNA